MLFETLFNSDRFAIFFLDYIDEDKIILTQSNNTNLKMMSLDGKNYDHALLCELISPINYEQIRLKVKFSLENNKITEKLLEFVINDKITYWNTYFIPVVLDSKKQILGKAFNITEILNKKNRLAVYLQTFFDNTSDCFYILDVDENDNIKMEFLNEAKAHGMNLSIENLINRRLDEFYSEENIEAINKWCNTCIKRKKTIRFTTSGNLADKDSFRNISLTPLFFENETKIVGCSKDVTETIINQIEKNKALEDLDFLFKTSTNGICILNINEKNISKIIKANKTFYEFLEMSGLTNSEPPYIKELSYVLNEKKAYEGQISTNNKQYGLIFFNISIVPRIEDDRVTTVYVTCVNTTEALKLSKRLSVHLTQREEEILTLVAGGNSNKYIAIILKISEGTVKKTIYRAFQKLKINSRSELIKFFLSDKNINLQ